MIIKQSKINKCKKNSNKNILSNIQHENYNNLNMINSPNKNKKMNQE